jgi:wobble nucleotide-excising tRNase
MITKLQLLRNVGQFDSVSAGGSLPLARLSLVYAENGRGKTTLAAVLRSLSTGDPIPVNERHRLSAQQDPHVVVDCTGGPPPAVFEKGAWNRTLANVAIFDDAFVDGNVHSGLNVESEHRQNLHELVLGAQGVTLQRNLDDFTGKMSAHNTELRERGAKIPAAGMGVDAFCALPATPDVDNAIKGVEQRIAAVREQDPIRNAPSFEPMSLPAFDLAGISAVLSRDLPALDAAAAERVREHVARLGAGGEGWLADGLRRLPAPPAPAKGVPCPFCLQDLGPSSAIGHYRAYFSAEYGALKRAVADAATRMARTHSGDVPAAFERAVRVAVERRGFWARFADMPEIELDTAEIARAWKAARDAIAPLLEAKQASPLDKVAVPEPATAAVAAYEEQRTRVSALSERLQQANDTIRLVKERAATGGAAALDGDLARLRAAKARHTPEVEKLCASYLHEKSEKAKTAADQDKARGELDHYRTSVFPAYQGAVNDYLQRFNAGFRIGSVAPAHTRGGTACNYCVVIGAKEIAVSGVPAAGTPSFRSTLSAGDRNTLALAFFFASLDKDPHLPTKTVVIDDPITSLDEHRSLATVQELRRLAARAGQVIVLSHDRKFLARIWEGSSASAGRAAINIVRDGQGSTIAAWDVGSEATTEYDRRHTLVREFLASGKGNPRSVAEAIRPVLEGFVRVARPEHFPPNSLLGPFLGICDQHVGKATQIFARGEIDELRAILEYANRFHHDTNAAWETETVNDGELRGFAERAMAFIGR